MTEYQPDFSEVSEDYRRFVEKFKPKKTTDDCYTPEPVFAVVLDYVRSRYGIDPASVVRPFWPGGDYQKHEYPPACTVVDNPPFSILSRIINWYALHGIRFFLFAPALTTFVSFGGCTAICAGASVTYANGAVVNTSFVTNLDDPDIAARSDPDLHDAIERASVEEQAKHKKNLAKLAFPTELITAARMNFFSNHGVAYAVRRSQSVFVRKLDNYPSGIFGGAYLLSPSLAAERAAAERAAAERAAAERAAAERAAAERAALSDRERRLVALLDRDKSF